MPPATTAFTRRPAEQRAILDLPRPMPGHAGWRAWLTATETLAQEMLGVQHVACESALDVDLVLERVLEAACELTGARYAALGILDRSRSKLERFITAGLDEPTHRQIGARPRGRGVLGELIADPRPLRLADLGAHPHSYGFPSGHPSMKSFLGVPVLVAGEPFGNLYLSEKPQGEEFSEEDEQALVRLAGFAGVAIDDARRHSGVDEQRSQLNRTVQALAATVQIARGRRRNPSRDDPGARG